ncbi:hypothetical protein BDQ17DRAFT_1326023 [Cyathus striatus]|nr:hypothetical protein BDQ17DRAFT_1326023 [Cyathus striatus]
MHRDVLLEIVLPSLQDFVHSLNRTVQRELFGWDGFSALSWVESYSAEAEGEHKEDDDLGFGFPIMMRRNPMVHLWPINFRIYNDYQWDSIYTDSEHYAWDVVAHPSTISAGSDSKNAFLEPVASCLPYIRKTSKVVFDHKAVLVDEERIIGLKDSSREVRSFDVFYFG